MPTLSDKPATQPIEARSGDWTARNDGSRRSVFGNYRADDTEQLERGSVSRSPLESSDALRVTDPRSNAERENSNTLQFSINSAIARSFVYRFLAQAYEDPTPEGWRWLTDADTLTSLRIAVAALSAPGLAAGGGRLAESLTLGTFESFLDAQLVCFGHAARGSCPLNEIEYGDIKADGLFQPHRLADLAAFYRAFGLDVADDATERQDHLCLELEFMTVLAAKEAYALEHQLDASELALCRDAEKKFLREHLGRWTPGFARRLARMADGTPLAGLADFTRAFIESECARFQVPAGSEDLLLRPVDEAAESLCASCSLAHLPPGAATPAEDL